MELIWKGKVSILTKTIFCTINKLFNGLRNFNIREQWVLTPFGASLKGLFEELQFHFFEVFVCTYAFCLWLVLIWSHYTFSSGEGWGQQTRAITLTV